MRHLDFQGQNDPQTKKQPFQFVCHVQISGKLPLICTSSSSGSRYIAFYVFINGEGGHFGNRALAELADIFKKDIGAHFPLKCFR